MSIMTGNTGFHRIVGFRDNLGESGWPGRDILMAERAITPFTRCRKFIAIRIFDVCSRRAMAHFAHHVSVIGHVLFRDDIIMTVLTGFLPDVFYILCSDLIDGRSSVMSIFSEIRWD